MNQNHNPLEHMVNDKVMVEFNSMIKGYTTRLTSRATDITQNTAFVPLLNVIKHLSRTFEVLLAESTSCFLDSLIIIPGSNEALYVLVEDRPVWWPHIRNGVIEHHFNPTFRSQAVVLVVIHFRSDVVEQSIDVTWWQQGIR